MQQNPLAIVPLFSNLTRYEEEYWREYQHVNSVFADEVFKILRPDDLLWVHDYQLMLLPGWSGKGFPKWRLDSSCTFRFHPLKCSGCCPESGARNCWKACCASLVGFHTHDYTRDFLTSVLRTVGYEHQLGSISLRNGVVKVDTFPMGIDFERFIRAAASPETETRVAKLRARCVGQKVIFSVDRLDYTKGLINRLRGYELSLKNNPQWHGKVVFIISVAPSRIGVESYQAMKLELEQRVGGIVGAFGNVHWTPLIYQYKSCF